MTLKFPATPVAAPPVSLCVDIHWHIVSPVGQYPNTVNTEIVAYEGVFRRGSECALGEGALGGAFGRGRSPRLNTSLHNTTLSNRKRDMRVEPVAQDVRSRKPTIVNITFYLAWLPLDLVL